MEATIARRETICRDHYRITLVLPLLDAAAPGQFLFLGQAIDSPDARSRPFLRRAFSIAGLRSQGKQCEADIIYRVHGPGTRWLAGLHAGDHVSVLGPLGRGFEIIPSKSNAWLVAGGVGLPPVLWLAERLHQAGKTVVAFYGARTRDLIPLNLREVGQVPQDGARPVVAAEEFDRVGAAVILATDDGSLGFPGTVCQALDTYREAWSGDDDAGVVVYSCGPEAMQAAVAKWCMARAIECYVCLERQMACGMGTCQSCVVRVRDTDDEEGWRYAMCCSEGPVFDARDVIWPG